MMLMMTRSRKRGKIMAPQREGGCQPVVHLKGVTVMMMMMMLIMIMMIMVMVMVMTVVMMITIMMTMIIMMMVYREGEDVSLVCSSEGARPAAVLAWYNGTRYLE